jgi:Holliday junction resolvase RusA-like endonuclease
LGTEAAPEERAAAILKAYAEVTGAVLSNPLSDSERRQVRDWLIREERAMPQNEQGYSVAPLHGRDHRMSKPLIFEDLARKVGWLQQAPCLTCIPADLRPLSISFPIRVRPFTAQSLEPRKPSSLKAKIAAYMVKRDWKLDAWSDYEVCVTIMAIIPERGRRKDVDNIAKGLLDAMEGSVYSNDRLVQHLSVRRVLHEGQDGWCKVHVMPVL